MEPERHSRTIADDSVIELGAQLEPSFGRPPTACVEVPVARVEDHRVVGRVELKVRRSHCLELVRFLPENLCNVGEKVLERPILRRSAARIPEVREEAGAGERDLEHPIGVPPREGELLRTERTAASKLADDGKLRALEL